MKYIIGGSRWTIKEVDTLKKMYPDQPEEKITKRIKGRTWKAICYRAQVLKLKRRTVQPNGWSKNELRTLKREYPTSNTTEMLTMIDRTRSAIVAMAMKLKLKKKGRNHTQKSIPDDKESFWTGPEMYRLKKNYVKKSKEQLLKMFPRRDWRAIILRANKFGLIRQKRWTEEEVGYVLKYYKTQTKPFLMKKIPNRNWEQIRKKWWGEQVRASKHGVV